MNKIFKFIGCVALGTLTLASCSPEEYSSPNGNIPLASDYESNVTVTVDQETNYAYFNFESSPGVTPVWIIDGVSYNGDFSAKKYYRKAGDYTVQCKVKNANGISDGAIERTFTIDKTIMNGFGGFDAKSDKNLFKTATITQAECFYAPGWVRIADPPVSMSGSDFTVTLPEATTVQWQAQVPFETNISTVADNDTYDFSVILTATKDHPGVTIKFTNPNDDNDFYFAEKQALKAGEPVCFYMTGMPSRNMENLKLVFDFGGNAAGTEVVVENLVFIKSSDNEISAPEKTEPEPVWVDYNSSDNLWNTANPQQIACHYAPNWIKIADPSVTVSDGKIMIKLPEATFERWQAQVPFLLDLAIDDVDAEYDFLAVIESNSKFKPMVKLTDASDDDNYFFADDSQELVEGGELRFFKKKVKLPNPCSQMKLFFDFGGNPANTEITISNIILQKHRE